MRVAVLVSGSGTNLQALLDAQRAKTLGAKVAVVISNKPGVAALDRAAQAGVPTVVISHKDYGSREGFDAALAAAVRAWSADLVVLAGCRLAKGPNRSGDSPANLGGAFLLGGATAVVQSRFALPLHRVRTLLVDLLAALAQGDSPAESLRRARAAANSDSDPLDVWRTGVLQVQGCGQGAARATGSRSAGSTYR
jgi:hypothetical protein